MGWGMLGKDGGTLAGEESWGMFASILPYGRSKEIPDIIVA